MIRPLAAAAAAALAVLALAGAASAQTWGQPVYLNTYGRPVGGTPRSEVERWSCVRSGRWADGYSDRPVVHVPGPGHGCGYSHSGRHGRGYDGGQGRHGPQYSQPRYGRYDPPSRPGYRDEWGYNDDRPPAFRRGSDDRRSRRHDDDCGCGDVYLYDR